MGDKTGIAWTDATWSPIRGCSKVSAGCANCYAERIAGRFSYQGMPYHGLARDGRWTGEVRLIPEKLDQPLRWTKPRRIFVNSMSDLFHEKVADETIDRIFAVMALAQQHTFQVLTKRPERMRQWFRPVGDLTRRNFVALNMDQPAWVRLPQGRGFPRDVAGWPLPNVHLGVSVEDQATADARIPLLLDTPAAVRFVSYEPALGSVDFRRIRSDGGPGIDTFVDSLAAPAYGTSWHEFPGIAGRSPLYPGFAERLDWIIVGGESGPRARPCDVAWIRSTVKQCRATGVPVFVKQLGSRPLVTAPRHWPEHVHFERADKDGCPHVQRVGFRDRAGADHAEWPEDLRVQEFPS